MKTFFEFLGQPDQISSTIDGLTQSLYGVGPGEADRYRQQLAQLAKIIESLLNTTEATFFQDPANHVQKYITGLANSLRLMSAEELLPYRDLLNELKMLIDERTR